MTFTYKHEQKNTVKNVVTNLSKESFEKKVTYSNGLPFSVWVLVVETGGVLMKTATHIMTGPTEDPNTDEKRRKELAAKYFN